MMDYQAAPDLLPGFEVFTDRTGSFGVVYQLIETVSTPTMIHDTFCPWNGDPLPSWLRVSTVVMEDIAYPEPPDPETAFSQYAAAYQAGGDYSHLHPCVQQAIDDVYGEGAGNTNYLAPRAFTRHYDDYWYKVWQSNIGGRHAIAARFPVVPATWETRERRPSPPE